MKKLFIVCLSLFLSANLLTAQTVPNGGFEDWTANTSGTYAYELPDQWKTTDSASLAVTGGIVHSAIKETSLVHGGSYAIKLIGWPTPFPNSNAPGAASNGDIDISTLSIIKGTPDTVRHQKLNGFYIFTPVGGDTCHVIATLVKWNSTTNMRDTIAIGEFSTNDATGTTAYSPFSVDFNYMNWTDNPDTMVVLLLTSRLNVPSGNPGTTLYVDDLSFTGVVGIDDITSNINSVKLYPSPASSIMTIKVDLKQARNLHYAIYDISGKHIFSDVIEPNETRLDVSNFAPGNYSLHLMDGSKKAYSTGFIINR